MAEADAILISKVLAYGDVRAFDQLVQRYQARVRGWLRHQIDDAALADGVARETFLYAWRRLSTYKTKESFETWLISIARGKYFQAVRTSSRETAEVGDPGAEDRYDRGDLDEYQQAEVAKDKEFAMAVLSGIRRRIWKRRLLLLSAISISLVIAVPSIAQLLLIGSHEITGFLADAEQSDKFGQLQILLAMLPLREAAQATSDELANISARMGTASWFQWNHIFVLAGLIALVSLVSARLLGR